MVQLSHPYMTIRKGIALTRQTFISKVMSLLFNTVYCHPTYVTYMQSTPCEMPGWMKHKLESRLLGETSIISDMQMITLWQKVKWSEVTESCPTLCDPVDCIPPGSSVHGILQARILEWVAIFFSRRYSWPRDWTQVSHIAGRRFNLWATREAPRASWWRWKRRVKKLA